MQHVTLLADTSIICQLLHSMYHFIMLPSEKISICKCLSHGEGESKHFFPGEEMKGQNWKITKYVSLDPVLDPHFELW